MARFAVLALTGALAACAAPPRPAIVYKPVEVEVPVGYRIPAPDSLMKRYQPAALPKFISPRDPAAAAALSKDDLIHLKTILRTLHTRDEAWRAWAAEGAEQ